MQPILLPKSICNELDAITWQFLWGGMNESKKIHLVKWDSVYEKKLEGGLGLKPASVVNEAYMINLGWRFINSPNALWSKFLSAKYCKGINDELSHSRKSNWSPLWKGIMPKANFIHASISKTIGNGKGTRFWTDDWVNDLGPFIDYIQSPHIIVNINASVANVFEQGIHLIRDVILNEIFLQILAQNRPHNKVPDDQPIWKH